MSRPENRCDYFSDQLSEWLEDRAREGLSLDATVEDFESMVFKELRERVVNLWRAYPDWPKAYGDPDLYRVTIDWRVISPSIAGRLGRTQSRLVEVGFLSAIERLGKLADG